MNHNGEKKFKSVIKRIVWIPMITMIGIWIITIVACVYSLLSIQRSMIERNISSLQLSLNQLESSLLQIETAYTSYINSEDCHAYLRRCTKSTPKEKMLPYEAAVRSWLRTQASMYREVQTTFAYYENTGFMQFMGTSNYQMQTHISQRLSEEDKGVLNQWTIIDVAGDQYLLYIFNYTSFYTGTWIPLEDISDVIGLNSAAYMGEVYLKDLQNSNTLLDENIRETLQNQTNIEDEIIVDKTTYHKYEVTGQTQDLFLGILIPQANMYMSIPLGTKLIFALALVSMIIVCFVVLWLRRRIANPVKDLNKAMEIIAKGNVEYRLQPPHLTYINEFDLLAAHFNAMMNELEEVQFKLYETTIKEQRTELKYISQQIRPHFILNALNIIYTYDETEFPLVKKMVRYLSTYFRYIVNLKVDFVEVWQELEHIKNYLNIQKERYPDRFDYFVEYEAKTKNMLIPPLIIQTFVENCIKYGMLDDEQVFFYVLASAKDDQITLFIADTGHGFSEENLEKLNEFVRTRIPRNDLGVGVQNAIERMDILYNQKVDIRFENAMSGGATVKIILPVKTSQEEMNYV